MRFYNVQRNVRNPYVYFMFILLDSGCIKIGWDDKRIKTINYQRYVSDNNKHCKVEPRQTLQELWSIDNEAYTYLS